MGYLRNSRIKSELITRTELTERMFVTDRLIPTPYNDSLRDVVVVVFPAGVEKVRRIAGAEAAEKVEAYIKEVKADSPEAREAAERERRAAALRAEQEAAARREEAQRLAQQQAEQAEAERKAAEAERQRPCRRRICPSARPKPLPIPLPCVPTCCVGPRSLPISAWNGASAAISVFW